MAEGQIVIAEATRLATEQRDFLHYQRVAPVDAGVVPRPLRRYLEGPDGVSLAVNGSAAAVHFEVTPGDAEIWRVHRITIAAVALAGLTEGLLLRVVAGEDAAEVLDLFGGEPVKSLSDLAAVAELRSVEDDGTTIYRAEIALPGPVRLRGHEGERLRATVRDNLSGVTYLRAFVTGVAEEVLA